MSTLRHAPKPVPEFEEDRRHVLNLAWVCAICTVPAILLGYLAAIITYAALGENVSHAPAWADWIAWLVAIAVLLVPTVGAIRYGHQARQWGLKAGVWPMVIAAAVGGSYTLLVLGRLLTM